MMQRWYQAIGLTCAVYLVMLFQPSPLPQGNWQSHPHLHPVSSSLISMIALLWNGMQQDA
ncbi:MAG: hypothetical protein MUF72_18510 [Elainella sp. Prado103]|nr:hypothetical protein [Elainella sp. Prado103]